MTYQEIGGSRKYVKYEQYAGQFTGEPVQIVEGVYLGSYTDKTYGGLRYEIEDENGEVFVLAKSGSLDRKMERCQPGDKLKFMYNGKKNLGKNHKFAGKFFHDILVFKAQEELEEGTEQAEAQEDLF